MLPDQILKQLTSENDFLRVQLEDANYMLAQREIELDANRKGSLNTIALQSKLDMTRDEIYQMQDLIGDQQQIAAGAARREVSLENELLQSIKIENQYFDLKAKFETAEAQILDLTDEASGIAFLNKEISRLTIRVAELESNLAIAAIENDALREELVVNNAGKE